MGVKSKWTEEERAEATRRYAQGVPVKQIAAWYGMSVPAVYLWIGKAKREMVAEVKRASTRAETLELEKNIDLKLLVKEQSSQIDLLQRKLFELMVKHGEL